MGVRRACILLALATAIPVAAYAQSTEQVVKFPNDIEFKAPLRPGAPLGAIVYGDPTKPGLYVTRAKFAPGFKVMPHWHDEERTVVVLSGTFYFGVGEQWDESKMKAHQVGTFLSEPPRMPHYAWAKDGEVIIQITGIGPTKTTPIPQKQ